MKPWYCVYLTIIFKQLHCPKWSSGLPLFIRPSLRPLSTISIFTVSVVLTFSECHTVDSRFMVFSDSHIGAVSWMFARVPPTRECTYSQGTTEETVFTGSLRPMLSQACYTIQDSLPAQGMAPSTVGWTILH